MGTTCKMAAVEEASLPVLAVTAAVGAVVLLFVLVCSVIKKADDKEEDNEEETKPQQNGNAKKKPGNQQPSSKKHLREKPSKRDNKHVFTHPWLASSLRAHSSPILDMDFSLNGKYLVTCSEDRSFFMWSTKEFNQKEHKSIRGNVELDHANQIRFSPDNKALVMCLYQGNTVRVVKIGKKADNTPGNFQTVMDFDQVHDNEILCIGMSCTGKWIMSSGKDTSIKIMDLKGEVLAVIDTLQINNSHAAVSPCGRFVACSGFTSNVRVWEVIFDKGGGFKEVTSAFQLKGHSAGVHSFAFSEGSSRMATISKDNTWKLWDTNIEYNRGQEPYLLTTGKFSCPEGVHCRIALSPDGRAVAIAAGASISVFDAVSGDLAVKLENAHPAPISAMRFDNQSKYLVSCGGKLINVFHNVVGYRAAIRELEEKITKVNVSAQRERLRAQIKEAQDALAEIEGGESSN